MIYFDNAATTFPKPKTVSAAVYDCITEYCGNPGRSSHRLSLEAANKIYETRCEICELLGSKNPENVVFTLNATYAVNLAMRALIPDGGHIVISSAEHNSVWRPANRLKAERRCDFSTFKIPGRAAGISNANYSKLVIAEIEKVLRPDTSAVVCTQISNICPLELPVKEISELCKKRKLRFIVDASQSCGITELDCAGIDAVCAPGHKGLYGIQGSGFVLFGADDGNFAKAPEFITGGSGVNSLDPTMPELLPEKYEAGTMPTPAIAGLCEGIKFVRNTGIAEINSHIKSLCRRMRENLSVIPKIRLYGGEFGDGETVLFNIDGKSPSETASELDKREICARGGLHCSPLAHKMLGTLPVGAVRLSFGYFNTVREVDSASRRIAEITRI